MIFPALSRSKLFLPNVKTFCFRDPRGVPHRPSQTSIASIPPCELITFFHSPHIIPLAAEWFRISAFSIHRSLDVTAGLSLFAVTDSGDQAIESSLGLLSSVYCPRRRRDDAWDLARNTRGHDAEIMGYLKTRRTDRWINGFARRWVLIDSDRWKKCILYRNHIHTYTQSWNCS